MSFLHKMKISSLFYQMTNTGRLSSLPRTGRSRKEWDEDGLSSKPNVNEEYLEAFRTKSYMEICNKAQGQLGKTSIKRLSSSTSSLPSFMHLTEYLLEPRQETVINMTESFTVHHLLLEYFEASLEACHYCDTILEGIHRMRLAYKKIKRVVKLSKVVLDCTDADHVDDNDQTQKAIYRELASIAPQNNPLSIISPMKFRDIHDRYMALLHRLKSKGRKIRTRVNFRRVCNKVGGICLAIFHSALLTALLVLALHSIVGIVAAPSIMVGLVGLIRKRVKWVRTRVSCTRSLERVGKQLDVAAKGVYILINDLDTMSRMVKRLQDEVDHRKTVAEMCVKNGKRQILKQILREFHDHESSFLDQLEELEEHIYLCFLTINRSRRLVLQEIMEPQGGDNNVKHL